MDHMGIVFLNHKLAWGYTYGFGRTWLPQWLLEVIVTVWNFIACRIWGHNWIPDWDWEDNDWTEETCSSCCKRRARKDVKCH